MCADFPTQHVGTQYWAFETGSWVHSSPTVVDGTVFAGSMDGNLYAVDAASGEEEWGFETLSSFGSTSPTVAEGTVFIGSMDHNLYAVDAATGKQEWVFETGDNVFSSPTVVDGTVYVGSQDNYYAVNAASGEEQWVFETGDNVSPSPTVVDGTVFVGSRDSYLYAVDAASGKEQWALKTTSAGIYSSPTVADCTVHVGDLSGNLYAVDAATGEQKWAFETGSYVDSSPTVAEGIVFVGSADDYLYAVDAATGVQQWAFETGDEVHSSPTVADGTVFVGSSDNNLYAVDAATGEQEWSFETGGDVFSSPVVVDGAVFVGSEDNNLYAIAAGVSGSSEDSRVLQGTLGHHDRNPQQNQRKNTQSEPPEASFPKNSLGWQGEHLFADRSRSSGETKQSINQAEQVPEAIRNPPTFSIGWEELERDGLIASGGYADVYRAECSDSDRPVAIKVPSRDEEHGSVGNLKDKIIHTEADRLQRLQNTNRHEHIVRLFGSGVTPISWLALEYMDGGTLAERADNLSVPELLWVGNRIADALVHAHRQKGAHQDITPQNILFRETPAGTPPWPKLGDWGLAAFDLQDRKVVDAFSQPYAAPEQLIADRYGDPTQSTDIYQLGVVLYEALTGESRPSPTDKPAPPSHIAAVPEAVDDVILRALKPDHSDRHSTMAHFRDALGTALTEVGVSPETEGHNRNSNQVGRREQESSNVENSTKVQENQTVTPEAEQSGRSRGDNERGWFDPWSYPESPNRGFEAGLRAIDEQSESDSIGEGIASISDSSLASKLEKMHQPAER